MSRILIAEDDQASREFLRKFLLREGYEVVEAVDGGAAVEMLPQADLLLLDVMMPSLTGWKVAEIARRDYPDLPIIMLTALATVDHLLQGFACGVDDYVTKPYDLRALGARVRALLRRAGVNEDLDFDDLRIAPKQRRVMVSDEPVALTKVEFDLLLTLARYPGRVFSRERLLERVWGSDYFGTDRVVDVRMVSLRKKIGDDSRDARLIETVRGVGYRFRAL